MSRVESMAFEAYQQAEGVNVSSLKWISPPEYTPAHYRAKFITGEMPEVEEEEQTTKMDARTFGKLFHRACLEPDTMAGNFWVKPDGMSFATKEGKAWRSEHAERPIITEKNAKAITGMRDSVWRHAGAKALLTGARTEACLFSQDEHGTLRKGRLDAIPAGGNSLVDLKSIKAIDDKTVRKTITDRRYYVQAPAYIDLARLCGIERDVFVFIFVEKTPPYLVSVRPLDEFAENVGRKIYQADLARLRNCLETNQWPGDPNDGTDCGLTSWMQSQLEREGI